MRILLVLALLIAALPLSAVTIFGLRNDNHLVSFDSATPGTVTDIGLITGMAGAAGEAPGGIDHRPLDGVLYLFSIDNANIVRTYTLNIATAAATLVGATASGLALANPTAFYGFAFNPTVDRVRLVNTLDENARINPLNGALAGNDTDLNPAAVEINAVAYDRGFAGTTATTVFAIDRGADTLVRIGGIDGSTSPNGGVVTTIGPLGVDAGGYSGMDIDASSGVCYAAMTVVATCGFYTINLTTGAATLVGNIGSGTLFVHSVSVATSANAGPVLTLPANQTTPADTDLVLSGASEISVSDADSGINPLELQIVVSGGTISLATTLGLTFNLGNGTDDILVACTGTAASIDAALASVTFTPAAGFNGNATISISVSDGGAGGFGGPQSANDVLKIAVGNAGGGGGGGGGGDDESSCTTQPGASWFWLALAALSIAAFAFRQAGLRRT